MLQPAKALSRPPRSGPAIAAAIALCSYFWHPALYLLAVMFIGSRQHALLILGHDASHYRYLRTRWQNDLFANLFLMWPTFASVEGFRKFHGTHHQYTNLAERRKPPPLAHPRRRGRAGARVGLSQDAGSAWR